MLYSILLLGSLVQKMFIFKMQPAEFADAGVFNCSIMGLLDFFSVYD